jgi:hypothetical protein
MSRIHDALRWLAAEFSATRDDFRSAHKAGSDMLLDGIVSHGYASEREGRYALTDAGLRAMEAG